jgi:hypothetical protein
MQLWYSSVNHLAERAFELQAKRSAGLEAQDLRVMSGEFCLACKGGPRTTAIVGDRSRPGRWSSVEVCSTCRRPWSEDLRGQRDVIKGEVDIHPRVGATEAHLAVELDEWGRLEKVFFAPGKSCTQERWEFAIEAWKLWLHSRVGSYFGVAVYGHENSSSFGGWWTEQSVRYWLEKAQGVVIRRALHRPRMISPIWGRRRQ